MQYHISISELGRDPFVESETGFWSVSMNLYDPFVKLNQFCETGEIYSYRSFAVEVHKMAASVDV